MQRARRVGRAAVLALVAALVGACAAPTGPSYPVVPVREIALEWRPEPGMRLVHHVTMALDASGPLTGSLSDDEKKPRSAVTRVTEVAAVGPDYFDLRFAQDGVSVPATVRFSRAWEVLDTRFDQPPASGTADRHALDGITRSFTQSAQFFRRWTTGDTQRFEVPVSGLPGAIGSGAGAMTFRRVVVLSGREAAEFDWRAEAEFVFTGEPGHGAPGHMEITGREWRDLATGASLRLTADATASFSRQGKPTKVKYVTEEILDLAESRLP